MPPSVRAKSITVGTPARATAAASCSGPEVSGARVAGRRAPGRARPATGRRRSGRCAHTRSTVARAPRPRPRAAARRGRPGRSRSRWRRSSVEPDALGDRGRRPRLGAQRRRRGQPAGVARRRDHGGHERGGGEHGVLAAVHRRRARVARATREDDLRAPHAEAAVHRAARRALVVEHGSLLDVQLGVGDRAVELSRGARHLRDGDAVVGQRVGQPDAVRVAQLARGVDVEQPARRRRPEQRVAEARPLLVGPVHQRDGAAVGLQRPQRLGRRQQAEAAVEPAAVRHAVHVRADHHRLGRLARPPRPDVPGDVAGDVDARYRVAEPGDEPLALVAPLRSPGDPAPARPRVELAQPRDDGSGVLRSRSSSIVEQCTPPPFLWISSYATVTTSTPCLDSSSAVRGDPLRHQHPAGRERRAR